ncbi:MAG: alanine--tRNA ligase [bacterium]
MTSREVRESFIEFFRRQGHTFVPSAPVVPQDDPTLLFTNAGMNQFKPIFLGLESRDYTRAANTQKCIRVSGKHNDLEEVGPSPYHHTFFEMLGNWSFGDYFKREAILWAWELMTDIWRMPKERLYATIYEEDDEAEKIWFSETDIAHAHVLRFGKKDNFWEMGETGPCGPCSEIHIDRGPEFDDNPKAFVNTGSPRFIELWNLVFIQFNRLPEGKLEPLPAKHVDTGAGLERITAVLGGKRSNYETDLFMPLMRKIEEVSKKPYVSDAGGIPHRVIADHVRCLTFAICDGAMPGNEGRGYVLRRILRRAARFGRKLDVHEPFIYKLVPILVNQMADVFPELKAHHHHASLVIKAEEEHFGKTLDRGLDIFDQIVETAKRNGQNILPGEEVFRLYDTFGFPLDLTELMAREQGLQLDAVGFQEAMEAQRERARKAGRFAYDTGGDEKRVLLDPSAPDVFVGYDRLEIETIVNGYAGQRLFLQQTPFYAESGGQVGDRGAILADNLELPVADVQFDRGLRAHIIVEDKAGLLPELVGRSVVARVAPEHRLPTQYNHTATHLLHRALRGILGDHVHQQGSLVAPDYFRFDYSHFQKPTADELSHIEERVNEMVRENLLVTAHMLSLKRAQELGAMALFGEKYAEKVRMIQIGTTEELLPWGDVHIHSRELCGGCHVKRTGDIGLLVIRNETAAAAGIRRIEALTGEAARHYLTERSRIVDAFVEELGSHGSDSLEKLRKMLDEKKTLEKELTKLKAETARAEMQKLATGAAIVDNVKIACGGVEADSLDHLKELGDALRDALGSGVGVLTTFLGGKPHILCVVTPDLVAKGFDAVPVVKELGKHIGGGGGGKPHLATAGGRNPEGLKKVLEEAPNVVRNLMPDRKK